MADRSQPSPGRLWEVVGGADKGGILVRVGRETTSQEAASRLSTGAIVEELELQGERLRYRRREGTGPDEGWVSTKLKDKDLCIPAKSSASRRIRVLCLHGTAGSPTVMKTQLSHLIRKCDKDVEFVFHGGHLTCSEDDDSVVGKQVKLMKQYFPKEVFTQYAVPTGGVDGPDSVDGNPEDPSTWRTYDGLEECLELAQKTMAAEAPIDAVLGFSQGSNVANLIAAQAATGRGAKVNCVVHLCTSLPGWTRQMPELFEGPLPQPALVVKAEKDKVATGSDKIAALYTTSERATHSDVHRPLPGPPKEAQELSDTIHSFLLRHGRG